MCCSKILLLQQVLTVINTSLSDLKACRDQYAGTQGTSDELECVNHGSNCDTRFITQLVDSRNGRVPTERILGPNKPTRQNRTAVLKSIYNSIFEQHDRLPRNLRKRHGSSGNNQAYLWYINISLTLYNPTLAPRTMFFHSLSIR